MSDHYRIVPTYPLAWSTQLCLPLRIFILRWRGGSRRLGDSSSEALPRIQEVAGYGLNRHMALVDACRKAGYNEHTIGKLRGWEEKR